MVRRGQSRTATSWSFRLNQAAETIAIPALSDAPAHREALTGAVMALADAHGDDLDGLRRALLALLKHPLVRLDLGETSLHDAAEALEEHALRGPRPRRWSQLHERLLKAAEDKVEKIRLARDGKPAGTEPLDAE